jgi:hypothetical protein
MAESLAVHILLLSFQGSPIQDTARRIIEGSNSPGYPKTTTEVRIMLEPAWDLIQLESLKVTEEQFKLPRRMPSFAQSAVRLVIR